MFFYDNVLKDLICDEKKGCDYICSKEDKVILRKMLSEVNKGSLRKYKYLAELDYFNIPNTGKIYEKYIKDFKSEAVKCCLISQLIEDNVDDCDELILELYLHFKNSDSYIADSGELQPAYICTSYDNAFSKMKSKRIKKDLVKLAYNPRDAFYLPLTMKMLARWKIPEIKEILLKYLDDCLLTAVDFEMKGDSEKTLQQLHFMKRDLKLTAIDGLRYFPNVEIFDRIKLLMTDDDADIRAAAEKSVKTIEKNLTRD